MNNDNEFEYDLTGSIYYREKSGNLKIKDDKKFIQLIMLNDEDAYKALEIYAKKILKDSYPDVPYEKYDDIILIAIAKALHSYDPSKGAGILTYLTSKIRGEVSDWKYRKNADERKIIKEVNEHRDNYMFQSTKERDEVQIVHLSEKTPGEKLIEEDIYARQLKAFRMAYSQLPLFSQYVLNRLIMEQGEEFINKDGKKRKKRENYVAASLAEELNLSVRAILNIRNNALSLILKKVLRSSYLTDDEKEKIKELHGITDEMLLYTEEENEQNIEDEKNKMSKIARNINLANEELKTNFSPEEIEKMKKIEEEIETYLKDKELSFLFEKESNEEQKQAIVDFDLDSLDLSDDDF